MAIINTRDLVNIKTTVGLFLSDSCTIYLPTEVTNEYGAPDGGLEVSASGVSCSLVTVQTSLDDGKQESDREILEDVYKLLLATTVTIDVDYVVEVNSEKYQITAIRDKLSYGVFIELDMRRIRE